LALEVGIKVAEEGAAVVAPRAVRRHPPVDAEDVVDGAARAAVLAAWCGGDDVNHRPVGNPKRKV
jgi:uncharacterized protein YbjT (DUF2867 family)